MSQTNQSRLNNLNMLLALVCFASKGKYITGIMDNPHGASMKHPKATDHFAFRKGSSDSGAGTTNSIHA
jgi:hypothetical protein